MKKLIVVTLSAMLFSTVSWGQFNTGSTYFSGATHGKIGFETQLDESESTYSALCIGLTPEAGYFIKNRLAVGGSILMDLDIPFDGSGSNYEVVFGPNIRYYLPRDTDMQVFLFGFGGYGFVTDHQLVKIMLGPGINYFLTERIAFEAKALGSFSYEWNRAGGGDHVLLDVTLLAGISLFFSDLTFITRKGQLVE